MALVARSWPAIMWAVSFFYGSFHGLMVPAGAFILKLFLSVPFLNGINVIHTLVHDMQCHSYRCRSTILSNNPPFLGCFVAVITWVSQITNVSGAYAFVFTFAGALGAMTVLPVGGALFHLSPFNVVSNYETDNFSTRSCKKVENLLI